MESDYYFFIGTVAELIKIMPVMHRLAERGIPFKVISSGQNPLDGEPLFDVAGLPHVSLYLTRKPIKKSVTGLLAWFVRTLASGVFTIGREFRGLRGRGTVIVHGDTLSTVMGALLGKLYGLRVAHVEAGLRSHNFLQPFPEELDRYVAAYFADVHFAPSETAVYNLRHRRGIKVNTGFNTNIDSLAFAKSLHASPRLDGLGDGEPFWIFIMHRQENLLNRPLLESMVSLVEEAARGMKCVFVAHAPTRAALESAQLYDRLASHDRIVITHRLPYVEFMNLLQASRFIITDGGGNQQECYYLGKPCLLLRSVTEGDEGLGRNVLLSANDPDEIRRFIREYERYEFPEISPEVPPSEIVVRTLTGR